MSAARAPASIARWRLDTTRLAVRPVRRRDLAALAPVYQSNRAFLALTEIDPRYAPADLWRDLQEVRSVPGRHLLAAWPRPDGGPLAVLELLERNPRDATPWIGLLIVHANATRRGLGREVVEAVCERGRALGWAAVRVGVLDVNAAALRFWEAVGFRRLDLVERPFPAGARAVWRLERCLAGPPNGAL